jgi:hypothetical protein
MCYCTGRSKLKGEIEGRFVVVKEDEETGKLIVSLTEFGRETLTAYAVKPVPESYELGLPMESDAWDTEIEFRVPHDTLLYILFDDPKLREARIELLDRKSDDYGRIGALTDSPIIGWKVVRNVQGEISYIGGAYWFPQYQVESELETLLKTGSIAFDKA